MKKLLNALLTPWYRFHSMGYLVRVWWAMTTVLLAVAAATLYVFTDAAWLLTLSRLVWAVMCLMLASIDLTSGKRDAAVMCGFASIFVLLSIFIAPCSYIGTALIVLSNFDSGKPKPPRKRKPKPKKAKSRRWTGLGQPAPQVSY